MRRESTRQSERLAAKVEQEQEARLRSSTSHKEQLEARVTQATQPYMYMWNRTEPKHHCFVPSSVQCMLECLYLAGLDAEGGIPWDFSP